MGRVGAIAGQIRLLAGDARWLVPLAAYRLTGRRIGNSADLYRAGILSQRLRWKQLPGMTAATERAYFKWHAQEVFSGRGAIVDLGSWFGSTTVSLAKGLVRNPRPAAQRERIHAFDRFEWEWWMAPYANAAKLATYADGDSFLPEFERVVSPWRERINVHAGDLREMTWPGRPIEALLVDAMKSWDLADQIQRTFYGHLIEDRGYVIHQDFSNIFTPWIHLTAFRLREYLVPAVDVVRSETLVFRVERTLRDRPELLKAARDDFDEAEVEQAFRYSLDITLPEKHSGIHGARAMLAYFDGDADWARAHLDRMASSGKVNRFHSDAARQAMETLGPSS